MVGIIPEKGSRPATRFPPWLISRIAILTLLSVLSYAGILEPLERLLSQTRFEIVTRPASQTLAVVEIDSASLHELDTWPWPRGYYAQAIENLRRAGARTIGFDVDMSARADPVEDAKLAATIAAGDHDVVLPVFMQPQRRADDTQALAEIQPEDRLRAGALLASINMVAGDDGILRRGYYDFPSAEGMRPSMAAVLSGKSYAHSGAFYIDFGITRASIPHLSFADLLTNKFDPNRVRGRNVLIGATALELGDEFAVPTHGIVPGVYLHALSYESILQGRTLMRPSLLLILLMASIVVFALDRDPQSWSWMSLVARHSAVLAIAVGAPLIVQSVWPVSLDTSPLLLAQFLCLGRSLISELERRAREILRQRFFNAQQQALISLAFKDNSDGIIVTDAAGCIRLCNERAATLLGVKSLSGAVGSNLATLVPDFATYPIEYPKSPEGKAAPADCFPIVTDYTNGDQTLEITADWALCEDPLVRDVQGGHIFVYTMRDATARKRIEAAERELRDRLIAASEAKNQFIHNMSHELRTPLNAVIGFSEMITSEVAGPIGNGAYANYARYIHEGGKNLLNVINDVLEVTRLESGKAQPNKESVDLRQLIERARANSGTAASDTTRSFVVNIPEGFPPIVVDPSFFVQVLKHLFSNAFKFTLVGGRVDVIASLGTDRDVIIEVRDNGVGVDKDHLRNLTEAFYQADPSLSRKHEGTGLGLYLVTKYLTMHDARLELESEVGKGFVARIVLPNAASSAPESLPQSAVA